MEEESQIIELSSLTVDELLERAESSFAELLYPKAAVFYQEAHRKGPDNEDLLCSYANFLTTTGDPASARGLLRHALELNIEKSSNYKKFVQMAELVNGELSVQLYSKAVEILRKLYNPIVDNDPIQTEIKRDLAQAYSALAEVYQTDLLEFKESEALCLENIELALKTDGLCLDAFLQYANYFLNKEDVEQARKWLRALVDEIRKEEEDDEDLEGGVEEEKKTGNEEGQSRAIENYGVEFRLAVARALIEVEEWEDAVEMLEDYLDEDSGNNEAVYLLAFCNFKAGKWERCREVVEELGKKEISGDEELASAVRELQLEVEKKAAENKGVEEGKNEEGEDDWMDVE